jgi:hypothetical protein
MFRILGLDRPLSPSIEEELVIHTNHLFNQCVQEWAKAYPDDEKAAELAKPNASNGGYCCIFEVMKMIKSVFSAQYSEQKQDLLFNLRPDVVEKDQTNLDAMRTKLSM